MADILNVKSRCQGSWESPSVIDIKISNIDLMLYFTLLFELMWNTDPDHIIYEPDNYEEVQMAIYDATEENKNKAMNIILNYA